MIQPRESFGLIGAVLVVLGMMAFVLFRNTGASAVQTAADVAVSCGFAQRAVVHQSTTAGLPRVAVECVDLSDEFISAVRGGNGAERLPGVVPAVYSRQTSTPVVAPRPVKARPVSPASTERLRRSSWQKRALIIGGSAGAGAGIGALVAGNKGALIGAAVGGGGAALVDVMRQR